jgi:hypothetical protein
MVCVTREEVTTCVMCVAKDKEGTFPATVDEEPVSCTSGWVVMSWLRERILGINHSFYHSLNKL